MDREREISAIQELRIASERLAVIADAAWSRRMSTLDMHKALCTVITQIKEAKKDLQNAEMDN